MDQNSLVPNWKYEPIEHTLIDNFSSINIDNQKSPLLNENKLYKDIILDYSAVIDDTSENRILIKGIKEYFHNATKKKQIFAIITKTELI